MTGSLSARARQDRVRSLVERDGTVNLAEVAEQCGVSEMTVRRDLNELERTGLLRRVRGGAVAVGPERFERRAARNEAAKARIAAKALPLLPTSGYVAMDSSSTVYRLVTEAPLTEIAAFTTGIETFSALRPKVSRAILSGGELDEGTGALEGPIAIRSASEFGFNRAFLSVSSLDAEVGATEWSLDNAEMKRTLARRSASVVLLVDSSKLTAASGSVSLTLGEIDVLITELDPADPLLNPYRDHMELL